jgi:ubiquinone/menaquinone biosynthesis C-methylase UbiE
VAGALQPVADLAVERAGVTAGMRVLDVGAGNGNAAHAALQAGADEVAAAEPEQRLLAAGRERLPGVEWVDAPASALPFGDASFDAVLSLFGAIFDPDHERTAAELARVRRPGGAVAMTAWLPEGPMAEVGALLADGAPPPPPGAGRPPAWSNEDYLRERLGAHGLTVEVTRESLAFTGESLDAWMANEERYASQWNAARERLGDDWQSLRDEVRVVLAAGNEDPAAFRVTSWYLLAVAR